MVTSAIILAGGLGTRLRDTVPDLPKPMAPICGRPFLEYLLDYWINQGIRHFVLSVGYRHEIISTYFGTQYKNATLDYAIEQTPLGTGGGFLLAMAKLNPEAPFLLLNGDTYFAVDLQRLTQFASENDADWCFSLFRTHEGGRYMGMEVSSQGSIMALKSGVSSEDRLANGGVYWIHPRAIQASNCLSTQARSLEDDIFPAAIAMDQRLLGLELTTTFIDIGVPDDYHRASTLLG